MNSTISIKLHQRLDEFFDQNLEMKACRDTCNGFKHVKLEKPSLDKDFKVVKEYDYLEVLGDTQKNPIKYHFAFECDKDTQKSDVFEITCKCYHLWEGFIACNDID